MTNTLLISEKYVKTQSNIQDNVWGDFLTPAIREAQDIELQPIIGRPLYKKILKEVEEKDVEARFKTLIEDWIQPYLLYQTIVSLIPIIGTKLGNIGTVISNDEHVQNLSSSERENLEYRYRYLADHYKSELQKYLLANKDLYPELTSTCLNNLNLKSSNSLPLWTGGVRHGQRESTDCPDKADYADPDGRKAGYIEGGKTVSVTKNNATTTLLPSEGYEGFSSVEVEVNVPIEESKTVKITENNSTTTISASEGYDGIKDVNVEVNVPIQDKKTVSVTENNSTTTIVPDEGYDGISIVDVDVNIPIQDKKTVEITSTTGTTTIVPDEGYDGIKNVELNINAQYPQVLYYGQTLHDQTILVDYIGSSLTNYFNFKNISNYNNLFRSFKLYNENYNCIFDGDFTFLGNIKGDVNSLDGTFYGPLTNNGHSITNKYNHKNYQVFTYKLPKITYTTFKSIKTLVSSPTVDGLVSFDYKQIQNLDKIESVYNSLFTNTYTEDPDFFKDFKINPNLETLYSTSFINNMYFNNEDENKYLNLNYLLKQIKSNTPYHLVFNTYGDRSYGNLDVSEVIWNTSEIYADYWSQIGCPKFKFSNLTFSDTSINTYKITSKIWTDQQNLQEFIDVLPQNTTSRSIKLSSQTMNALTDEMKATAANKNWTLTT